MILMRAVLFAVCRLYYTKVTYMTGGATWSPSYDLRVDTQADAISCTFYCMVTQTTDEDWEGVRVPNGYCCTIDGMMGGCRWISIS